MDQTTTPTRRRMRWAALALLGTLSLVAAAACGDDDDGGEAAAGGGGGFCETMRDIDERGFENQEPTPEELEQVMNEMSDLDPPAEIEESWDSMLQAMGQLLVNPTSAEAATAFEEASPQVDTYLQDECGIS
ncbi:MAG TPA: hypothetical protein VFB77_08715 [Acidimicrobiales bacterium]|nr:hypothetical protein [Acidimicrobiales bacterium]